MTITSDALAAYAAMTEIMPRLAWTLDRLHDQLGGLPATASGASASSSGVSFLDTDLAHDDQTAVQLTAVERNALRADGAQVELRAITEGFATVTRTLDRIGRIIDRHAEPVPVIAQRDAADCPDDWCRHCWTDDHHHSPIAVKPDGTVKRTGCCDWCGKFIAANKFAPTLDLLRKHHLGQRITTADIENVVRQRAQAKKAKKSKGP